jgi:hypothetical protein
MYYELLKEWCDTLISFQITEIENKRIAGGIMCPSCARIHGRSGDAIYPLMFMAKKTGDHKYLESAKKLFLWSENMAKEDGSYYNDTNSDWRGITVFAAIQLGESLYYHGDLLDKETKELWFSRLKKSLDYLYNNIDKIGGNINYPVTCAAAMAIGAILLKRKDYEEKARWLAHNSLKFFTEDGLLFGEGKPNDGISKKGCRPVDIGYNVEESLPGLATYALLLKDDEVLDITMKSMEKHVLFMLPDGAWDNSFGTRNNKWSYWGSRTSDGCQAGYGLLADKNPLFAEVVYRNTCLLKECTHDGLLHGGPMFVSADEPPCVHHTICHAKAIAIMLEHGNSPKSSMKLPREYETGITWFPSVHVGLIAKGSFRATISDYDYEYSEEGHGTGGAITMLWNREVGPLLVGTMTKYSLIEPNNMQLPKVLKDICLTPRLELIRDGKSYLSINDLSANVEYTDGEKTTVTATGNLKCGKQNGQEAYQIHYEFHENEFTIKGITSATGSKFYLPVISNSGETVEKVSEGKYKIIKNNGTVTINSYSKSFCDEISRVFNPVGGFEAIPFSIVLNPLEEFKISISIEM